MAVYDSNGVIDFDATIAVEKGKRFLFVLLPRWEQTGTVCPTCYPTGSNPSDPCDCYDVPTGTISGETAGGN